MECWEGEEYDGLSLEWGDTPPHSLVSPTPAYLSKNVGFFLFSAEKHQGSKAGPGKQPSNYIRPQGTRPFGLSSIWSCAVTHWYAGCIIAVAVWIHSFPCFIHSSWVDGWMDEVLFVGSVSLLLCLHFLLMLCSLVIFHVLCSIWKIT